MVNTIDTNFSQFRGWISIKGLPFVLCTVETFKSIANQFGHLIEIDLHTLNHRNLFKAKIRVECNGASSIPQIIPFPTDNRWILSIGDN